MEKKGKKKKIENILSCPSLGGLDYISLCSLSGPNRLILIYKRPKMNSVHMRLEDPPKPNLESEDSCSTRPVGK